MEVPEIDVAALADHHGRGAVVVDVRNPEEYEAGHVPGARLVPLPELADRVAEVPVDEPVFVICAMGGRSRKACELLLAEGRDVTNIAGGTRAWVEAGHPVTTGERP